MAHDPRAEIRLILDSNGTLHDVMRWSVVPAIGDKILVRNVDGRDLHLPIRDVMWGDDADSCIVALMIDDTAKFHEEE